MKLERIATPVLDVACEISGPDGGPAVVLLHGFPYDPRCFDAVVPLLVATGLRVIVPYVRGYGPTRFRSPKTPRSGQQAAVAQDVIDLLDRLGIERAILAGFDWGSRAGCIVAALRPERVLALMTCSAYQVQDIARSIEPADPEQERRFWYQYYFNTERGRAGLARHRRPLCRLLWELWSPTWRFDDATYEATAVSFDNPDFVAVCVHSYRHRYGNAQGDPRYNEMELQLATMPTIGVPTIALHGSVDGVHPVADSESHARFFAGPYERRVLEGIGHNPAQESPADFARAILDLAERTTA
jgi:pimeloyl-ACP methyl ester carboxylesterase